MSTTWPTQTASIQNTLPADAYSMHGGTFWRGRTSTMATPYSAAHLCSPGGVGRASALACPLGPPPTLVAGPWTVPRAVRTNCCPTPCRSNLAAPVGILTSSDLLHSESCPATPRLPSFISTISTTTPSPATATASVCTHGPLQTTRLGRRTAVSSDLTYGLRLPKGSANNLMSVLMKIPHSACATIDSTAQFLVSLNLTPDACLSISTARVSTCF